MLHRLSALSAAPGLPFTASSSTPEEFFFSLEKSLTSSTSAAPCSWVGELYLELHQGTLTSQAKTKKENRRLENLLRLTEFLATAANCQVGSKDSVSSVICADGLFLQRLYPFAILPAACLWFAILVLIWFYSLASLMS